MTSRWTISWLAGRNRKSNCGEPALPGGSRPAWRRSRPTARLNSGSPVASTVSCHRRRPMHTGRQQTFPARVSGQQRALAVNQRRVSAKTRNAGIGGWTHEEAWAQKAMESTKEQRRALCSLGLLLWARITLPVRLRGFQRCQIPGPLSSDYLIEDESQLNLKISSTRKIQYESQSSGTKFGDQKVAVSMV